MRHGANAGARIDDGQHLGIAGESGDVVDHFGAGGHASRATIALEVSMEMGVEVRSAMLARPESRVGALRPEKRPRRRGAVLSPPTSSRSAPAAAKRNPCSTAASRLKKRPPSEKLSGVTLTIPISRGRASNWRVRVRNCQLRARSGYRCRGRWTWRCSWGGDGFTPLGLPCPFGAIDAHGDRDIPGDVDRRAAHVEQTIDSEDDADSLAGHAHGLEHQHNEREGAAGNAGRADAGQDRHEHDRKLLRERQFDSENLGQEQDGDPFGRSRFRSGLGGRTDGEYEAGDVASDAACASVTPVCRRQRGARRRRAERREDDLREPAEDVRGDMRATSDTTIE